MVTALGSALLAAFHAEPWQLMLGYAIGAGGVAIAFGAMPKLIADAVSPTETGIATGMNTVVRTVGSVIGSQAAVTLHRQQDDRRHLGARPRPASAPRCGSARSRR